MPRSVIAPAEAVLSRYRSSRHATSATPVADGAPAAASGERLIGMTWERESGREPDATRWRVRIRSARRFSDSRRQPGDQRRTSRTKAVSSIRRVARESVRRLATDLITLRGRCALAGQSVKEIAAGPFFVLDVPSSGLE